MYNQNNPGSGSSDNQQNGSYSYNFRQMEQENPARYAAYSPEYIRQPNPGYGGSVPQPRPEKKKRGLWVKIVAICLCCLIVGAAGTGTIVWFALRGGDQSVSDGIPAQNNEPDDALEIPQTPSVKDNADAYAEAAKNTDSLFVESAGDGSLLTATDVYYDYCNSVVGISTEVTGQNVWGYTSSYATAGTGFIISQDGYILTNHHVIADGENIEVTMYDGQSYTAKLIGSDETNDIALLKIDAQGLTPVQVGSIDDQLVGEDVCVIGNPLGELTYTLTTGSLSALERTISIDSTPISMFQIDAAVNSGNSGGPVFNMKGEVIGVVTAKYSTSGVEGLGFAIPINDAVSIAESLYQYGYVKGRAFLGIGYRDVDAATASYYSNMVVGVYVGGVTPGSCAETAGLVVGDIIVGIGGVEVSTGTELIAQKNNYKAGDTTTLKIYRNGEYLDLTVTFDEQQPAVEENPLPTTEGTPFHNTPES